MADPRLSDDELIRQIEAAREADRLADTTEPRARAARFEAAEGRVVVELKSGASFAFPPALYPQLAGASPRQLAVLEVSPSGEGLSWPELDVDIAVSGVLLRLLGPLAMYRELARTGGRATSSAKSAAARANGRKGGRPRKAARGEAHYPSMIRPHPGLVVREAPAARGPGAGSAPPADGEVRGVPPVEE
ncbi:MAG TPA: DUF2442 domain-containing protein [Longimicrobium sp.]|nr:DUF2442 domain-containing protein [Longimicrobium sp.]